MGRLLLHHNLGVCRGASFDRLGGVLQIESFRWERRRSDGGTWSVTLAPLRCTPVAAVAPIALAITAISLATRCRFGDGILQDPRPVELDVRVVLLEEANRFFVDGRPADTDARRRAEPVEKPLALTTPSATRRFGERRRLVAALVTIEAELRQELLPLLLAVLAVCAFRRGPGLGLGPGRRLSRRRGLRLRRPVRSDGRLRLRPGNVGRIHGRHARRGLLRDFG